ncbi:UDP-N-acetylmuramate--L-alanine ligase [Oscillospiraceae bacterium OttesenSCG-928-F05]|nr:UDP-N-acetylmuramate--L-alanine ligase [Oscillospiraceae bacterium OttesenSCG-928-F05]
MGRSSGLEAYLKKGKHAFVVGAGGVSMSALCDIFLDMGLRVSGSDMQEGETVYALRAKGAHIYHGHKAWQLDGCDFVVRTAAAHDDNPEIQQARLTGVPVFERAEAWGVIMRAYRHVFCVAGTHGKTTTTSMAVHIATEAGRDPTAMVGGVLPLMGSSHRVGSGDLMIAESCEYMNSFLHFHPTVAAILNVEADHLDFFKDYEDVRASFVKFLGRLPSGGIAVLNADDPGALSLAAETDRRVITFGVDTSADYMATAIDMQNGCGRFTLTGPDLQAQVTLRVPGRYNILNALAAAAGCHALGIGAEAIEKGLLSFTGARRRFEYKGLYQGARIYDDYAHHPTELRSLLNAVEGMHYDRTILAFQPHTYSRTRALLEDFAAELRRPDIVCLAPIYAARERDPGDISSETLAAAAGNGAVRAFPDMKSLTETLGGIARPGDLILTVGAGDIYRVGELLAAAEHTSAGV